MADRWVQDGAEAAGRDPGRRFIVAEASVTWPTSDHSIGERFEELLNVNVARGYVLRDWHMTTLHYVVGDDARITETVVAVFERGVAANAVIAQGERVSRIEAERDHYKGIVERDGGQEVLWIITRDATIAALAEARRVLREVEWEASARICPICASAKRHGHLPDCRLKAALEGQ